MKMEKISYDTCPLKENTKESIGVILKESDRVSSMSIPRDNINIKLTRSEIEKLEQSIEEAEFTLR